MTQLTKKTKPTFSLIAREDETCLEHGQRLTKGKAYEVIETRYNGEVALIMDDNGKEYAGYIRYFDKG